MSYLRADLINALAKHFGHRRYLEIGLGPEQHTRSAPDIHIESTESVDPFEIDADHVCTSDQFFATQSATWDLIFIDGDHARDQVLRDVSNSLACLNPGGTIVMHDCNPPSEERTALTLNGTVWEAWAHLRMTQPDLDLWCVDMDEGCGVIRRGSNPPWSRPVPIALSYAYLEEHRRELLNLVSWDEFWGTRL